MSKRFGLPTDRPEAITWGLEGLAVGDHRFKPTRGGGIVVVGPDGQETVNAPNLSFSKWRGGGEPVVHVGPMELLSLRRDDLLLPWTFEDLFHVNGRYGTRDKRIAVMNTPCGLRAVIGAPFDLTVWLCVRSTHTFAVNARHCN